MADYRLVIDPMKEIRMERAQHRKSLAMLTEVLDRVSMRDASGQVSKEFCRLCEKPPPGTQIYAYRQDCPHHRVAEVRDKEIERMLLEPRATVLPDKQARGKFAPEPPPTNTAPTGD